MKSLRAAVLGLGVGEQHIAGYDRHPHCTVTALCDFADDKLAMARAKYPHLRVTRDAQEILTDPEIDVVSIATYDSAHASQILTALAHGKHVFVEKPMCLLPEEADAIRAALKANPSLKLSSNLILRKCPRFVELRQMMRGGDLGRVYYLEGDYNYGRIHKITGGWRSEEPFYSVVHGGAIHLIDLLLWLTGERVVEATALGNQIASAGSPFHNHDMVVSLLRLESGAIAKVSANFGCVHPHFHAVNIYGTQATFQNGVPDARLYRSRDPNIAPERISSAYPGAHKGDLLHSFLDSILHGGDAEVTADDVFAAMSVSLAIETASHQSGPVPVRYI